MEYITTRPWESCWVKQICVSVIFWQNNPLCATLQITAIHMPKYEY